MSRDEPPLPGLVCLRCEYDLTGLPQHRCPECGTEFDPEEVRRVIESSPKPIRASALLARVLWPAAVFPLIVITARLDQEWLYGTWTLTTIFLALVNSIVTVGPLHAAIRVRFGRSRFGRIGNARAFLSFLLLFAVQCVIASAAAYAALRLAYA